MALLNTAATSTATVPTANPASAMGMRVGPGRAPRTRGRTDDANRTRPQTAIQGFFGPVASATEPSTGDRKARIRPAAAVAKPHRLWPVTGSGARRGGEIGREHEGGDEREEGLAGPVEEAASRRWRCRDADRPGAARPGRLGHAGRGAGAPDQNVAASSDRRSSAVRRRWPASAHAVRRSQAQPSPGRPAGSPPP